MYRYSIIICKELKLSKQDTKDISLAAYLSNIGVIGISDQVLTNKGKYSEVEYSMMKLHAESGASIIEATIGNSKIASYIRHHHERIDGFGYPYELKGDEIPLGGRIIAVVQTFLAKILGREYRKPIPFDQALNQLKIASGTQLDAEVVDAFINWFKEKELMNKKNNCALGSCYDMRCSPENICMKCPAYKDDSKNCWEHKEVHCEEHGNVCECCFVYTEYLYRMSLK
jgi:HD-GYP domain-containing protein (c-di-GMP phosphodiesterase class II)